ncbi:hypothetical protein J437_LFUL001742 [Ladona fulva]|uniref:Amidase domain-containing protein n=1 Tax=Ladona fulva TaxID=123851 RepID=A0A8K0NY02_LADFU|nr:hypothetical protein J437_LFUL001742 [Ladona fulva]
MCFTAGLYLRRDIKGTEDAAVVAAIKRAGAIPLALTNVSELCMWWESHNTVHGRTYNPYDANRIVGGSSGGERFAYAVQVPTAGRDCLLECTARKKGNTHRITSKPHK